MCSLNGLKKINANRNRQKFQFCLNQYNEHRVNKG